MKTYSSIEESLGTKKAVVIKSRIYDHYGAKREQLTVRKARGKQTYLIVKYENGTYSSAA